MLKQLVIGLPVFVVVVRFRLGARLLPDDGLSVMLPSVQTGTFIHADPTHHLPVWSKETGMKKKQKHFTAPTSVRDFPSFTLYSQCWTLVFEACSSACLDFS